MRSAFIDELAAQAALDSRIALVVGDLGFSVVEPFADRFPDRFVNSGVAEQNMMGLAAGMASEGYHPFVYSIANFPVFRCAEQIRNDVEYHDLPVTIVAVGGGLAYGNLGYSHHAVQDYGFMRMLPSMLIAAPGDPMEVRACVRYLARHPQPSYLRLGKAGEACLHGDVPEVTPGRWIKIVGSDGTNTFLTTGATLPLAREWLDHQDYQGWALHSLPLWGMRTKALQAAQAVAWKRVISVEDHLQDAGFGSWLLESCLPLAGRPAIEIRGLSSEIFGKVGTQSRLNALGGLK